MLALRSAMLLKPRWGLMQAHRVVAEMKAELTERNLHSDCHRGRVRLFQFQGLADMHHGGDAQGPRLHFGSISMGTL